MYSQSVPLTGSATAAMGSAPGWTAPTTPPPEVLDIELNLEAIAALEPDLILDTRSDGTQERYDDLAQIATTIGPPPDVVAFGTSWQQQLEIVGQALGKADQAAEVRTETEAVFEMVSEENPDIQGVTVTAAAFFDSTYGAYVEGDSRINLLLDLGMTSKDEVEELADGSFFVSLSQEQIDLLDAPVLVMFAIGGDPSGFTDDPLYNSLTVVAEGRDVVLEESSLINAFSSGTRAGGAVRSTGESHHD